jgi:uncharacterized cupin superfamily protein
MPEDHVVNAESLDWTTIERGDHSFKRKQLSANTAASELGCSLYELPAGKRDWMRHFHTGNEEAVFVLDGEGTLYLGPGERERHLEAGDFVALPSGEAGTHQLEGGEDGLRYLMVSTMNEPDITVYPDNDAVGLFAGTAPGGDSDQRELSRYLDIDAEVEYWGDE